MHRPLTLCVYARCCLSWTPNILYTPPSPDVHLFAAPLLSQLDGETIGTDVESTYARALYTLATVTARCLSRQPLPIICLLLVAPTVCWSSFALTCHHFFSFFFSRLSCRYWAVMTISSIGYGDIVVRNTFREPSSFCPLLRAAVTFGSGLLTR